MLLFIACLASFKLAALISIWEVTPVVIHRRIIATAGIFVASWGLTSLLASAFQCRIPHTWRILGPHCFNQVRFFLTSTACRLMHESGVVLDHIWSFKYDDRRLPDRSPVLHIVECSDAAKAKASPHCLLLRLDQVFFEFQKNWMVIIGIADGSSVVVATAVQVQQLQQLRTTLDFTFDSWKYFLSTQFVQNLSLITVCLPYIKSLLLGLESGFFQTGNFRLRGGPKLVDGSLTGTMLGRCRDRRQWTTETVRSQLEYGSSLDDELDSNNEGRLAWVSSGRSDLDGGLAE